MNRMRPILSAILALILAQPLVAQEATEPGEQPEGRYVTIRGERHEVYPAERLRARGIDVPEIPEDQNAAWVYVEAVNAMVDVPADLQEAFNGAVNGQWPEGEAGNRLGSWLEQNKSAMDLARQAAGMEQYHMPLFRGGSDALIMAVLPNLSPTRQLGRLYSVEATYLASHGQADAALESYLAAQRMGVHVAHGSTLIEGLVGLAVAGVAQQGMRRLADSGLASPEALKSATARMQALTEQMPDFEQMVRAEQRWAETTIDDVMELGGGVDYVSSFEDAMASMSSGQLTATPSNGWKRLAIRLKRLYFPDRTTRKHFRRHYDTLIAATKREDGTVGMVIEEDKLFQQIPAWDATSRALLPSLSRAYELSLRSKSNSVRTYLTLAAQAYKAEQGEYPSHLSALAPDYIASIPADPMTGYDFEYGLAGGDKPAPKGLEIITNENEAELVKKRRTPAILTPRASKWRRYVQSFCDRYDLTAAQRASAEAILRDLEGRAAAYEKVHGENLKQLIEAGDSQELSRRLDPLEKMFRELKLRLDAIPTAKQRNTEKAKKGDQE